MAKIEFHFKGGIADHSQLPVDCMINMLNNIRDLTYLIVAQKQGIEFNERFRPSKEITKNYVIKCELPTPGSYGQAVAIDYVGDNVMQFDNFDPAETIKDTLKFLQDADNPKIIHFFPNAKIRSKALYYARGALPAIDNDVYLEIANDNGNVINSRVVQKNLTSIIDQTQSIVEEQMTVVTGRLVSINFAEKRIVINHPVTRRNLDCFYNEDIEDMLYERRRELVQITGMVTLDDNEHPKSITDVVSIQEVDLSPIEFDFIHYGDKKLQFRNRLILIPRLDDSEQLYTIDYPTLGLETFAFTRQEITDDIKSEIAYLWSEYALANDEELSKDAIILKQNLLRELEEVA